MRKKVNRNELLKSKKELRSTQDYDIGFANNRKLISYLATPSGSLMKYDYRTGKIDIISNDIPSDIKDPDRMSNRLSFREMNPVTIDEKMKIIKNILYDIY